MLIYMYFIPFSQLSNAYHVGDQVFLRADIQAERKGKSGIVKVLVAQLYPTLY